MPSVFYRPSGNPSGFGWSANPHLAIDEVTASDSDYCFCLENSTEYGWETGIAMSGAAFPLSDIISLTWRYRGCVVTSGGAPTTPNSGQLMLLRPFGPTPNFHGGITPPSSWTTYSGTITKATLDANYPGYNWNSPVMGLYSFAAGNEKRLAISWLEFEFDVKLPSGVPLYHLINMM